MNKLIDWKNRLKKGHMLSVICVLLTIVAILGIILYKKQREYRQASENSYNMAFFDLVDYVENVENYLAKSLISSTPSKARDSRLALSISSKLNTDSSIQAEIDPSLYPIITGYPPMCPNTPGANTF